MSTLPYSKVGTPTIRPSYEAQFKSTPSIPALKRRLSIVAAQNQDPHSPQSPSSSSSLPASGYSTKLRIQSSLPRLESAIGQLVDGLGKFTATPQQAQDVIDADNDLSIALEELLEHQEAGKTIQKLKKISAELDRQLNQVLLSLSESRRELQSALRNVDDSDDSRVASPISANELLSYATKITKFTHPPPGYNPEVANEHANLPWPSEDGLRRGVLAMLAADAEKDETALRQASTVKTEPVKTEHTNQELHKGADGTSSQSPQRDPRQRRSSIVSYGERPVITNPSASSPQAQPVSPSATHAEHASSGNGGGALDLDLFDPDEEEDDEDDE
ncbi:Med4p [Sugiyamaella lignohabitans]|uniref:Mediator of RNA polymerase II transcription subunit 4 n=1 Tax=Sugiyamaella lignohabitans TaxID=796027 RepID=A0A167C9B6_9ASCO|nr:Med4p [Sugiyamaella lignohabitans]ANB11386.1 Med4p [Sugiyamaella lignohabitans]